MTVELELAGQARPSSEESCASACASAVVGRDSVLGSADLGLSRFGRRLGAANRRWCGAGRDADGVTPAVAEGRGDLGLRGQGLSRDGLRRRRGLVVDDTRSRGTRSSERVGDSKCNSADDKEHGQSDDTSMSSPGNPAPRASAAHGCRHSIGHRAQPPWSVMDCASCTASVPTSSAKSESQLATTTSRAVSEPHAFAAATTGERRRVAPVVRGQHKGGPTRGVGEVRYAMGPHERVSNPGTELLAADGDPMKIARRAGDECGVLFRPKTEISCPRSTQRLRPDRITWNHFRAQGPDTPSARSGTVESSGRHR